MSRTNIPKEKRKGKIKRRDSYRKYNYIFVDKTHLGLVLLNNKYKRIFSRLLCVVMIKSFGVMVNDRASNMMAV